MDTKLCCPNLSNQSSEYHIAYLCGYFCTMLTGVVSADSRNVYCYDSENRGPFCSEDRNAWEV